MNGKKKEKGDGGNAERGEAERAKERKKSEEKMKSFGPARSIYFLPLSLSLSLFGSALSSRPRIVLRPLCPFVLSHPAQCLRSSLCRPARTETADEARDNRRERPKARSFSFSILLLKKRDTMPPRRVLCVAEKNSVADGVARILNGGRPVRGEATW